MEKSTSRAVTAKTIKQIKDKKTDIIPNNDFSENDLDINFDQDGDRLLDSLREGCRKQYDPTKLNDHFANILNNPRRKEAQTFMPKEKCQTKKDGRRFMQVGGTEIFYNDSVVEDIINFGVRCRVSAMCHAN